MLPDICTPLARGILRLTLAIDRAALALAIWIAPWIDDGHQGGRVT